MFLRLTDAQAEGLRRLAQREGRWMQDVAPTAVDEYLQRADDDHTDHLAEHGAERFEGLLRRLGS